MLAPNSASFARLSPLGRGAIATLRIDGPAAVAAVAVHVRLQSGGAFNECPVDRPLLGLFGEEPGEPVVLHRRDEGAVEIHCHGGMAAIERIGYALAATGAQAAVWEDWVRSQEADSIAAEARIAMGHARTERTAAILLDQYGGALRRATIEIERLIAAGKKAAARERVDALLARVNVGRHLVHPWRVVLAGKPNVGKSSLLNALVGYERAIVHPIAGTTRDILTATTAIEGWPVELVDTAGLSPQEQHPGDQSVLDRGITLGKEAITGSDLLVLIFDRSVPLSAKEHQRLRDWPHALRIDNKSDLPRAPGPRPPALAVSAVKGAGLADLLRAIVERLVPDPPLAGAAVPFSENQYSQLRILADRVR